MLSLIGGLVVVIITINVLGKIFIHLLAAATGADINNKPEYYEQRYNSGENKQYKYHNDVLYIKPRLQEYRQATEKEIAEFEAYDPDEHRYAGVPADEVHLVKAYLEKEQNQRSVN